MSTDRFLRTQTRISQHRGTLALSKITGRLPTALRLMGGCVTDFEHLPAQFTQDTNDLAPRVGLAFSASPNWALRAGLGIFFDRYLLAAVNRALEINGVQGFEQVAYGQAATQVFQSEMGGSSQPPFLPFVRRSTQTIRTYRPRAAQSRARG